LDGLERLAFCTDGLEVEALCRGESLNVVLEKAVSAGLPLPVAIRMATLTPARRFGLAPDLGAIKPGAHADLVVWEGFRPQLVLVGGARPAAAMERFPEWALDTVHPAPVSDEQLRHPGPGRWR